MTSGKLAHFSQVSGVLAFMLVALAGCGPQVEPQDIPDVKLERFDGGVDRLSDWRGKVVILNIWATWCAPCRAEMPALQTMSEELDANEYVVVGLSIDKTSFPVKEYLRERGINFARHIDYGGEMARDVLNVSDIPQTLIINSHGKLKERIKGARAWQASDIIAQFPLSGTR